MALPYTPTPSTSSSYSSALNSSTSGTSSQPLLRAPQLDRPSPSSSSTSGRSAKGKAPAVERSLTSRRLEQDIEDFFQSSQPTHQERQARETVIARIQRAINSVETKRAIRPVNGYTVAPFGSTLTGIDTAGSDLDLCIVDNDRLIGFDAKWKRNQLPSLHDMRALAHVLRKTGFQDVEPVVNAAVPICKWKSQHGAVRIVGDANCNEQLGLLNSQLIATYCDLSPMLRRICVCIKHWAKQRDLNDPAGNNGPISVSSYTYTLMLIAYLQHLGSLPNLQSASRTASIPRKHFWSRPRYHDKRGTEHDVTFAQPLPTDHAAARTIGLVETLRGFFHFFANDFDPDRMIVSIVRGGIVPRNPSSSNEPSRSVSPLGWPPETADDESSDDEEEILYQGDRFVARHSTLTETEREADVQDRVGVPPSGSWDSDEESVSKASAAAEAMNWNHPFVVQDPFMLARNTACNIDARVYARLRREFARADHLISSPECSFTTICRPIFDEPEYIADQPERDHFRRPPRQPFHQASPVQQQRSPNATPNQQQRAVQSKQKPARRPGSEKGEAQRGKANRGRGGQPPPHAVNGRGGQPQHVVNGRGGSRGRGRGRGGGRDKSPGDLAARLGEVSLSPASR